MLLFISCDEDVDRSLESGDRQQTSLARCGDEETFVDEGVIPLGTDSVEGASSSHVAGIQWIDLDRCEKVVIYLRGDEDEEEAGTGATNPKEGEAAGYRELAGRLNTGNVRIEVLRESGLVRIVLPGTEQADDGATDAWFDGSLVQSAYVVRPDWDSGLYVDLHLADASVVHAEFLDQPARIVATLRRGGSSIPPPPVAADRVVVTEPRIGVTKLPNRVTGYARTFEANVVLRVEQQGEEIYETFTTAAGWLGAWGYFSFDLDEEEVFPRGIDRSRSVTLHLGEYSAKDGQWEGVAVDF